MDGLYFRVSSERQTTENQFEDLLQVARRTAPAGIGRRSVRHSLRASPRNNDKLPAAPPGPSTTSSPSSPRN